jgi:hypothetical protein
MKTKPIEIPDEIELHPDARERFERAVDKVMRSPPQPRSAKDREPSPARGGKRGDPKPA